jgi:hypothetical protein
MYLEVADIFWASVAMTISLTFVITTAIRNAKLTAQRDSWRQEALKAGK